METCLFAEPLLSNGFCIAAYFAAAAWQRVIIILYISQTYGWIYASVVWNSITSTDAKRMEYIQQKFAAFRFNRFFPLVDYIYCLSLDQLKLHALQKRRHHFEVFLLT
jgi:hypothetical protein